MDGTQAGPVEIRRLRPGDESALARFFAALVESGDQDLFHPHPLTPEHAAFLAQYAGRDLYYVFCQGDTILGYGILRGWDEGYTIPSLGLAIAPCCRGMRLGFSLASFLHSVCRLVGAHGVRATVYPRNKPMVDILKRLGYRLSPGPEGRLLGVLDLCCTAGLDSRAAPAPEHGGSAR